MVCPLPPNVRKSHRCYDTLHNPAANCDGADTGSDSGGLGPKAGEKYQAYAEHFCCRRPNHKFCECYNTWIEGGKFCDRAAFENWPGCKDVNPLFEQLKSAVPEGHAQVFTAEKRKCLGMVCSGSGKYIPPNVNQGCGDVTICSMNFDLKNVNNSQINAQCNIEKDNKVDGGEEAMEIILEMQRELERLKKERGGAATDDEVLKNTSFKNIEKKNGILTPLLSVSSVAIIATGIVLFMKRRPK